MPSPQQFSLKRTTATAHIFPENSYSRDNCHDFCSLALTKDNAYFNLTLLNRFTEPLHQMFQWVF